MAFYECEVNELDTLYVEDTFDEDGELSMVIHTRTGGADVMLSKESVKSLVEHLSHLLEESK